MEDDESWQCTGKGVGGEGQRLYCYCTGEEACRVEEFRLMHLRDLRVPHQRMGVDLIGTQSQEDEEILLAMVHLHFEVLSPADKREHD